MKRRIVLSLLAVTAVALLAVSGAFASGDSGSGVSQVAPFDGVDGQYQVTAGGQVLASGPALPSGFNR